jgi:hypothetical protein
VKGDWRLVIVKWWSLVGLLLVPEGRTVGMSSCPSGLIRGRIFRMSRSSSLPYCSILVILSKTGMFQALVKAVRLLQLGDANRMGSVPTALE